MVRPNQRINAENCKYGTFEGEGKTERGVCLIAGPRDFMLQKAERNAWWLIETTATEHFKAGEYAKCGKYLVTITDKQAQAAREVYFAAHREEIIAAAVAKKEAEIIETLRQKTQKLVDDFESVYFDAHFKYRFKDTDPVTSETSALGALRGWIKTETEGSAKNLRAKNFLAEHPEHEGAVEVAYNLLKAQDWNALHSYFYGGEIAVFSKIETGDMDALKKFFSLKAIDSGETAAALLENRVRLCAEIEVNKML